MNVLQFERLHKNVVPINYDLEITPDLKDFTFKGRVIIEIKVRIILFQDSTESTQALINFFIHKILADTTKLTLNSKDLKFDEATFECRNRNRSKKKHKKRLIPSVNVKFIKENELVIIEFAHLLRQGIGKVHISYSGILSEDFKGFFRSRYVDHASGEVRFSAATQFQVKFLDIYIMTNRIYLFLI